jgi:hypothetical protein
MKRDTVLNLCGLWAVWMDWLCSRKLHIILLGVIFEVERLQEVNPMLGKL